MPRPQVRILSVGCFIAVGLVAASVGRAQLRPQGYAPGGAWQPRPAVPKSTKQIYPVHASTCPLANPRHHQGWGELAANNDYGLVIPPIYQWSDYFYNDLARVIANGKTGYMNVYGNWVVQPIIPWADRFAENMALVRSPKGRYGYINRAGRRAVAFAYDGGLRFSENLAAVMRNGRIGFVNQSGKMIIPLRYAQAGSFHDDLAPVQFFDGEKPGALGYISRIGQVRFVESNPRLQAIGNFADDNLAKVKIDGKWGYLNRSFKVYISAQYENARDFANDLAAVEMGGRWGYIDRTGNMVISPQFQAADDFDSQFATVEVHGKWGYIDKTGRFVIPPRYINAGPFSHDRHWARVDQRGAYFMYINKVGDVMLRQPSGAKLPSRPQVTDSDLPYLPDYLYEDVLPKPTSKPDGSAALYR